MPAPRRYPLPRGIKFMRAKITRTTTLVALGAALLMAVGCNKGGSSELTDAQVAQRDVMAEIQQVQDKIAKEKKVTKWEVSAKDIQKDPKIKELKLDDEMGLQRIQGAISTDLEELPPLKDFSGYKLVDLNKPDEKLKSYSTNKLPDPNKPNEPAQGYEPLIDQLKKQKFVIMDLKVTTTTPAPPVEKGKPAQPPQKKTQDFMLGPIDEAEAKRLIEQAKKAGTEVETKSTYPVKIYMGPTGKLAFGVDATVDISRLQSARGPSYYTISVETLKKLDELRQKESTLPYMQPKQFDVAIIGYKKPSK